MKNAGTSYIVPDFLVEMTDRRKRLVEIKPSDRLARPKVRRKLTVARQFAAKNGWTFHVVTEKELMSGHLLSNVRLLNRYRRACLDADILDQLESQVPKAGIKLGALLSTSELEDLGSLRVPVFHLLATGRLSFDPCAGPLDNETLIFPGGMTSWDPFDSVWAPNGCSTDESGGSSANSLPTVSPPKTPSSM
jgi:hypothetical protein